MPPHAPHVPAVLVVVSRPEHTNPLAQVPLLPVPQHDCAEPPHVVQMLPDDFSTQEPEVHGVVPPPVQQSCPSPPQALQVPGMPALAERPEQAKPVLQVPVLPVPQQDCPEPPQAAPHTFPPAESVHDKPLSHVPPPPPPPGQQGWPEAPHALHVPPPPSPSVTQTKSPWQLLPPQQAAPAAPQFSQVPVPNRPPVTLQPRPVLQVLPEQQGSLEPPQAVQI